MEYRLRSTWPRWGALRCLTLQMNFLKLRRELILQLDSGRPRIEAVLECAEHLMTWLAILASDPARIIRRRNSSRNTTFLSRAGSLHLDWGKCVALLQAGATFTLNHPSPAGLRGGNRRRDG